MVNAAGRSANLLGDLAFDAMMTSSVTTATANATASASSERSPQPTSDFFKDKEDQKLARSLSDISKNFQILSQDLTEKYRILPKSHQLAFFQAQVSLFESFQIQLEKLQPSQIYDAILVAEDTLQFLTAMSEDIFYIILDDSGEVLERVIKLFEDFKKRQVESVRATHEEVVAEIISGYKIGFNLGSEDGESGEDFGLSGNPEDPETSITTNAAVAIQRLKQVMANPLNRDLLSHLVTTLDRILMQEILTKFKVSKKVQQLIQKDVTHGFENLFLTLGIEQMKVSRECFAVMAGKVKHFKNCEVIGEEKFKFLVKC